MHHCVIIYGQTSELNEPKESGAGFPWFLCSRSVFVPDTEWEFTVQRLCIKVEIGGGENVLDSLARTSGMWLFKGESGRPRINVIKLKLPKNKKQRVTIVKDGQG